ncbi:c-type cytochrome biogenesis protein CcmI [Pikeienuella piscinae]|uniref:C-type cytochrome biogenesis protein CcmI n=1 Tax=Pikeienuella piscinae TaxID=2748098 RepID=A0A7L5BZW1_9RHOB|nr:c-type cytochrome biogenesis protein CcmI [Pikeienuella piscinae]QIE55139.1 c-type cytochrome biogenesis protein CcmI [Pikeienuella piscinae]
MAFWIIAIAAALVAGLVAVRPLLASRSAAAPRAAHDAQVFRDQLKELERDVARGVVTEADAEATRLEISRRLLAADAESRTDEAPAAAPPALSRGLAAALIIAAPLAATWLYSNLGAPGAADMPLSSRGEAMRPNQQEAEKMMAGREPAPPTGPDAEEFERLVTQLEARLKEAPNDEQGIFLYARSLMNLARFKEAWPQFERLIELRGEAADADIYAGYAEAMILAAGGYISPEAEAALLQVLKREPTNPSARYYLGRLHAQDGAPERAGAIWTALLDESPPDAPWVAPIKAEMAALGLGQRGGDNLPGPTREEMSAAGSLPPADRQAMVADMVNRLAERLDAEGGTLAEWQRLIRSYSVLGDNAKAQEAMARAKEAFKGDPAALVALENGSAPLPAPGGAEAATPAEGPQPDRTAMIAGMVERLATRLRTEGGGPEDWLRLISSYSAMGRSKDADAAYREARDAFAADPAALAMLEAAVEGAPREATGRKTAPPADKRGPTSDEVAAAAEMAPADRQEMIRGMVAQLHERLQEEGNAADVNEWGKLMRSYRVLGDAAAVRAAYDEAASIFAESAISLAYLKEAALLNGVELN